MAARLALNWVGGCPAELSYEGFESRNDRVRPLPAMPLPLCLSSVDVTQLHQCRGQWRDAEIGSGIGCHVRLLNAQIEHRGPTEQGRPKLASSDQGRDRLNPIQSQLKPTGRLSAA